MVVEPEVMLTPCITLPWHAGGPSKSEFERVFRLFVKDFVQPRMLEVYRRDAENRGREASAQGSAADVATPTRCDDPPATKKIAKDDDDSHKPEEAASTIPNVPACETKLLFERYPSFRISMPFEVRTGIGIHTDLDYCTWMWLRDK